MSGLVEVGHVYAHGGSDVHHMIFLAGGLAADLYFGRDQHDARLCSGNDLRNIEQELRQRPDTAFTTQAMVETARAILSKNNSGPVLQHFACTLMSRTVPIEGRQCHEILTEALARRGTLFTFAPDPIAIHEAGHALAAHLLGMRISRAWLHRQHTLAPRLDAMSLRAAAVSPERKW